MKVSKTGYKKNSKDKNQPSLLIPSNRITMKNVEFPVYGVDDTGYSQMMYPGLDYSFPGSYVYEIPMVKGGGHIVPGRYRNPEGNWLNKYQDAGEVTPGMMSSGQKRSDYVPYKDVSGSPYEIQDPYIGNYSTVDIPENLSELPSYRLYTMAKGSPKPFSPDWNTGLNLNDQGYLKFDEKTGYNYQPSKQNLQDFQSLPMEGEKEFNLRRFVLNPYEGQPQTHDAYVKKDGTVDKENFIPTSYSREETMDNVFKDLYAQNLYKFKGDRDAAYTATSEFMKERVEPQYKGKYYDYMNNPNVSADDKLNINLKGSHMTVNPQQTEDYVRQQITNKIIEEHPEYMEQDEAGNYKISDDDLSDLVKADPRYKEKLNEYNDVLQDWYVTNKNMSPEEAKALVEKDLYKNVPKRKTTYATFKNGGWLEKYQDGSEVAANLPWINSQGQYQEPVKTSKALSDDDLRRIDISETSETTDTPAVRLAQQVAVQQHEEWQNRKPIAKKSVKKENYAGKIARYVQNEDKKVIDAYYKKYDPANEEQVKAIQAELVAKNFLPGPAAIDGKFGDKTKQAYLKYKTAERVGDLSGETKKSTCSYDGCAEYVSSVTRPYGWVLGDAWTMKNNIESNGGVVKYNIYTDPRFSRVKSKDQLKNVTETVKRNNKASADMFEVGDVVGLYYKGSNMHQTALKDGRGTYNTHVGVVTEIKDGKPIISHNIHGKLHHDTYDNLTIGWVGTPAARMAQYKPSKQPETLKDKINIYSKELSEILAPGVDSEKIANNIKGILRKETGLGRLTPTEADIKEIQAKRFLLGESTDPEDISRGIGKLKTSTIPEEMKYFLGINDENVDDDAGVKAAVYKYVDAYNQFKKYRENNPQLKLTDDDLHQMSILAYNQGTDKLLNLGYNNPSMPISSEVDALRDLYSGNIKDISSTNFKYLPSINTTIAGIPINIDPGQALYDLRYPEGHETYISRVNKYANTPIEELEASMPSKKLGGWLDQYQDGGLIETTRKLNKKYPGYSIWFDKGNIFIRKPSQNASWERLPSDIEFIKSKDGNLETSELMPIRPALMPPSNTMKVLTSIQEEDRAKQKPKVVKVPDFKEGGWLNKYQGDTQSSQVKTYASDPNYFNNRAVFVDNPQANELVRSKVYAGTHGWDPSTNSLVKLDKPVAVPEAVREMSTPEWGKKTSKERFESKTPAGKATRKAVAAREMEQAVTNPYFRGAIPGILAAPALAAAGPAVLSALNAPAVVGSTALPGVTAGNAIGLGMGAYGAYSLGQDVDTGYYGSDAPTSDKVIRGLETGLNILGTPGAMEATALGLSKVAQPIKGAYNTVATGESFLPVAWKSPAVGLTQSASDDMFRSLANSGKLTPQERALVLEYQSNSGKFTGRGFHKVDSEKREALNNLIKKYNLNIGDDVVLTRMFGNREGALGTNLENGRLNFGDRPTSFTAGVRPSAYGSANNRLVIPRRYSKQMGENFLVNQYDQPSDETLNLLDDKAREFSLGVSSNPNLQTERELIGTGLDFKQIGKVKNDLGGYDLIVKPNTPRQGTVSKQLPGSPNVETELDAIRRLLKKNVTFPKQTGPLPETLPWSNRFLDLGDDAYIIGNLERGRTSVSDPYASLPGKLPRKTPEKLPGSSGTFRSEIDWRNWVKNKEDFDNNPDVINELFNIERSTKADGTWMKNPDGSPFEGTPEQFVVQQSKNFKRAFGESQLLNPDGSPMFLYHGSAKKFDTFDPSKFQLGDAGYSGAGIYTTPSKTTADSYSLSSAKLHTGDIEPTVYQLYGQGNRPIKSSDLIKQNKDYDLFNFHRARNWKGDVPLEQQMLDYDAAVSDQLPGIEYIRPLHDAREIVFPRNTQVKSAVGNILFDMSNPNIYKGLVPAAIAGAGALQKEKDGGWLTKYQRLGEVKKTNTPPANLPWINQQGQFTQVPPVQPKSFERKVDEMLGSPQKKAWEKAGDIDNKRHGLASLYTQQKLQEYLDPVSAAAAANILGAAHEVSHLPERIKNSKSASGVYHNLIETAEDMFNNAVGAGIGMIPFVPLEAKESFLMYLSDNNMMPDGVSMAKGDMYWKKKKGGEPYPSLGYYEYIGGYSGIFAKGGVSSKKSSWLNKYK